MCPLPSRLMKARTLLICLISVIAETFFFSPQSPAQYDPQIFNLGPWEGQLESRFDFARRDTKTAGSSSLMFRNIHDETLLTLRNISSYILDPGLVNLTLGGTFGMSQDWFTQSDFKERRSGTLWGYDAFVSILAEKPYSLNLFANRNQSSYSGDLAGQINVLSENRGATLFARRLYLPSMLTFRQEIQESESRVADTTARREERRNIVTYQGERGWVDSEMSLRYEFIDSADKVFPKLSYRSNEGTQIYGQDFGEELNWHWDSRLRGFMRTGVADTTNVTIDELLRIDHSDTLKTNYRYSFARTGNELGSTMTNLGQVGLTHRLYESLTSNLSADASMQSLPGGRTYTVRGGGGFDYTKRLPADGRLNVRLGGSLEYENERFPSGESAVLAETLTFAAPFALPIALRNPFVIISSVVVRKVAFGPLPFGCVLPPGPPTPLVLGVDYTLNTVSDLTEVVPIPCAGVTAGINPGDVVEVDYRFNVPNSLAFIAKAWHAGLSLDYRWIRPYYSHEQTTQTPLSGSGSQFLTESRSDTVGVELRYEGQRLRAGITGERRWYQSTRLSYDSTRSTQFLIFTPLSNLTLGFNAEESLYNSSDPKRETLSLSGRATVTYLWNSSLFIDAFGGYRRLNDSQVPTDQVTEAGVRARWYYRKVEISPTFQFTNRQRGDTESREFRLMLQMIRRFSYP